MILSQDHLSTLIDSPAKLKLLKQLMTGGVLTERRLAQYAGLSHVYAGRLLQEFERFHLVQSKRVGKANLWEVNRQSYAFRRLEPLLLSLDQILSPLEALKEIVRRGSPRNIFLKALLYGSVIHGTERDTSDVDLCLVLNSGITKNEMAVKKPLEALAIQCYESFGKRLSSHIVSIKEWGARKKSPLLQEIEKGVTVFDEEI